MASSIPMLLRAYLWVLEVEIMMNPEKFKGEDSIEVKEEKRWGNDRR